VLFEAVVNAVHRMAPQAAIAFNTRPEDSGEAAAPWDMTRFRGSSVRGAENGRPVHWPCEPRSGDTASDLLGSHPSGEKVFQAVFGSRL
jgi:hypothetical protein